MADEPTLPGENARLFDGRYRVLETIGRGGFGEVQLVRDTLRDGREVALKSILPEHAKSPEFGKRFDREIDVLRTLQHPSIPQIINDGRAPDGTFYFTMEYVDGTPLGRVVEKDGPFPPMRLARVVKQLAQVLDYAHSRGVVHRDLKPGNILIENAGCADERVHVLDFGIAKLLQRTESDVDVTLQTAGFVGTPEYASPEQVLGDPVDGRTDTYSLGILIHFLATGKYPFSGKSRQEIATKRLHTPPTPLERGEAPREIRALVGKLLERDRDRRPELEAISRTLERVLSELGNERKNTRRYAAIAAALAVVAAGVSAYGLTRRPDEFRVASHSNGEPQGTVSEPRMVERQDEDAHESASGGAESEQNAANSVAESAASPELDQSGSVTLRATESDSDAARVEAETDANNDGSGEQQGSAPPPVQAPPPLRIVIESPQRDTTVGPRVHEIEIAGRLFGGTTDSEARVFIGTESLEVKDGAFRGWTSLDFGTNLIDVSASVDGDPRTNATIAVIRQPPMLPDGATLAERSGFIGEFATRIDMGDPAIALVLVAPAGVPSHYLGEAEVTRGEYERDEHIERAHHPVTGVGFDDAQTFAQALGARLPTQDEWLEGGLAGDSGAFPWGPDFEAGHCNGRSAGHKATVSVRDESYAGGKSWCGLWHMSGNVAEWVIVEDRPVAIGGSYMSREESLRLAPKTPRGRTMGRADVGFRLAVDLPR